MARGPVVALLLAAIVASVSGARVPLAFTPAPSPAAYASQPWTGSDLLFLFSADKATFTTPSTLVLDGISRTAASFAAGGKSAVYSMQSFTSASNDSVFVDSDGKWLGQPDAILSGSSADSQTQALLILSRPVYDQAARSLTFTVGLLQPQPEAVKFPGGAVSERIAEYQAGTGASLMPSISAGASLTDVVVFIDQNQHALKKPAATKALFESFMAGGNNNNNNNNGNGGNNNNNNNNNNGRGGNNNNNNNNGGNGGNNNNNNNNGAGN